MANLKQSALLKSTRMDPEICYKGKKNNLLSIDEKKSPFKKKLRGILAYNFPT